MPARNCPKRLGRAYGVALRAAKRDFPALFAFRIQAKPTVGASLVPFSDGFPKDFHGNWPPSAWASCRWLVATLASFTVPG